MSKTAGMLVSIALEPKTPDDRQKLADGLQRLTAEDQGCSARAGAVEGQVLIGASSEHHLEVVVDRLKREFKVEAWVGRPQVVYRVALTRPADGEMKYARYADGAGQYAHVKMRLYPREPGAGYVFENHVLGGAVPSQFIQAVDEGIREALSHHLVAGLPVHDVRAELYDGSYHDVDSSEWAFRAAGSLAAEAAVRRAQRVLLEPVMRLEVVAPPGAVSDIVDDLTGRRGQVQSKQASGDMLTVQALVPLAELFGYTSDLHSRTRGRGTCSMRFETYVQAQTPDDGGESLVGVPLRPVSPRRDSGIALPEPDESM